MFSSYLLPVQFVRTPHRSAYSFLLLLMIASCSNQAEHDSTSEAAIERPDTTTTAGVQFADITAASGIDFTLVSGSADQNYIHESMGGGVAFLDYDNDGHQDIFMVSSTRYEDPPAEAYSRLYRNVEGNTGGRRFDDVTLSSGLKRSGWGMGCATGDYDNDGDVDLFVTYVGPNAFYRNEGDGTFVEIGKQAGVDDRRWGASAAFGDIDADGFLDLYVANYLEIDLDNPPPPRRGWKGLVVYFGPAGMTALSDILYRNDADGTFTDMSNPTGISRYASPSMGVVFADFDIDGDQDFYVAVDGSPNQLFRNDGNWNLTEVGAKTEVAYNEGGRAQAGMGVDAGDYDNDGDQDIFVTNYSDDVNTLYQNQGDGTFFDATFVEGLGGDVHPFLSWSTNLFDYDNDEDNDIFVANGHLFPQLRDHPSGLRYPQVNLLYRNDEGRFMRVDPVSGPAFKVKKVSRGGAFADFDNDGDTDVLVTNLNDTPTLIRNDGGSTNNWLGLRLIGTDSNRDAIGAHVLLFAGDKVQMREVRRSYGYQSANDVRLLFGLAQTKAVDKVEIRWPSGRVQKLKNPPIRKYLVVEEGRDGIVDSYGRDSEWITATDAVDDALPKPEMGPAAKLFEGDPHWNAEVFFGKGEEFYDSGRYDEALSMFEAALDRKPNYIAAHRGRAATLIKGQGRYQEAVRLLEAVVARDSSHAELLELIGMSYVLLNRPQQATEALRRATKLDSTNWTYLNWLGRAYMAAGDLSVATSVFQRAIQVAPYAAEPHLQLSRIYERQRRSEDAKRERAIHERLDIEKQNLASTLHLLRSDPDNVQKLRFVGTAYVKRRQFPLALRYFERLVELEPSGQNYFALGVVQHQLGHLEAAVEAYEKAYKLEPRLVVLLNDLGRAYHQMGRLEEAIAAYLELLQRQPRMAQTRANLGEAYAEQGKKQLAIDAYRAALELDSTMESARIALRELRAD